jgi:hypothetical protein
VCALIPELHHDGHSPQLTPDEQKAFYEKGLRPAIARLTDLTASKWPATYEDEMFHARGWNGQLSFCSRVVGEWLISNLGDAIRDSLAENGCSWGTGLVFFHQVKWVKHPSGHTLNAARSKEALHCFLEENNLSYNKIVNNGFWLINVGLKISSTYHHCLA